MNEKLQIVFAARWSCNIFVWYEYDERMSAEGSRREMKTILALLTKNSILGVLAGALTTAVLTEQ